MKSKLFFENTRLLFDRFSIVPLLYGSLGLEYLTGCMLDSEDIDILIPEAFLKEKWHEFKDFLKEYGYILIDEHEHTFLKDGIHYSYASIEELETFSGIIISDIPRFDLEVSFKLLTLEQYLRVYKESVKDGYRINTRKKKDKEKIDFIETMLKKEC